MLTYIFNIIYRYYQSIPVFINNHLLIIIISIFVFYVIISLSLFLVNLYRSKNKENTLFNSSSSDIISFIAALWFYSELFACYLSDSHEPTLILIILTFLVILFTLALSCLLIGSICYLICVGIVFLNNDFNIRFASRISFKISSRFTCFFFALGLAICISSPIWFPIVKNKVTNDIIAYSEFGFVPFDICHKNNVKVEIDHSCLQNNHVGNEWRFKSTIDGDDCYSDSVYTITPDTFHYIHTYIGEYDSSEDYYERIDRARFSYYELLRGVYVMYNLSVIEDRGRYAGNEAIWQVKYTFRMEIPDELVIKYINPFRKIRYIKVE